MDIPLRVHICVVGFELDRISKAAIEKKADKVYLISQKESDKGREFLEENTRRLKGEGVIVQEEFVEQINELSDLLGLIKKIIKEEDAENNIYLNISSGSTLSAIAGTIISMMFGENRNIIPYYVKPDNYFEKLNKEEKDEIEKENDGLTPRSIGVKEINEILTFPIRLPSEDLIIVLKYLQYNEKSETIVRKKDLIEFTKKNEFLKKLRENKRYLAGKLEEINNKTTTEDDESKQKAKDYAWINQNIINKLKDDWNLINVKKIGKYSCIELSSKGKKMLNYLND